MATEAQLTAYRAALEMALYSGALVVKHGDTQTTFRSVEEIKEAIATIDKELRKLAGIKRKPRYARQPGKGESC